MKTQICANLTFSFPTPTTFSLLCVWNFLISSTSGTKRTTIVKRMRSGSDRKYTQLLLTTLFSISIPRYCAERTQSCPRSWSEECWLTIRIYWCGTSVRPFTIWRKIRKSLKCWLTFLPKSPITTKYVTNRPTILEPCLSTGLSLFMLCRYTAAPSSSPISLTKKCSSCSQPFSARRPWCSWAKTKQFPLSPHYSSSTLSLPSSTLRHYS